jgi:c(7)-type cytochrome triheme protein
MRCDDLGSALRAQVVFLVAALVSGAGPAHAAAGPAATATSPLRLPATVSYELAVGPDRAVVFSHETHVPLAGNRCTTCHPRTFRILAPTTHIEHREMEAGRSCGSCHDGHQAFDVRDSTACSSCHTGRRAVSAASSAPGGTRVASRGPRPIVYSRSKASPGAVTFRHATHVASLACGACHPRPFAMKVAQTRATLLHDAAACGGCHDGARSFAVEDPESCARCHAAPGGAP